MVEVLGYRDSWLIALLYIGTFGSFIGFSLRVRPGAADQLPRRAHPRRPRHPAMTAQASLHAAQIAFIGPLLGLDCRAHPVAGCPTGSAAAR